MRSYSGLLVFESVFDTIDPANQVLVNLADQMFSPLVPVKEANCFTNLGQTYDLTYESEGYVELATGLMLSNARINYLLGQGIYKIQVRSLSTCITEGGVCQKCYSATNPHLTLPVIGSTVKIPAKFVAGSEVVGLTVATNLAPLSVSPDVYDYALVFSSGALLPQSAYSISNGMITLTTPPVSTTTLNVRYVVYSRTPFMYCLAKTYAGSMMGMKPLPSPMLPLKPRLLADLVPDPALTDVVNLVKSNSNIPEDSVRYLDNIPDRLEKALYALALGSVYSGVSS